MYVLLYTTGFIYWLAFWISFNLDFCSSVTGVISEIWILMTNLRLNGVCYTRVWNSYGYTIVTTQQLCLVVFAMYMHILGSWALVLQFWQSLKSTECSVPCWVESACWSATRALGLIWCEKFITTWNAGAYTCACCSGSPASSMKQFAIFFSIWKV